MTESKRKIRTIYDNINGYDFEEYKGYLIEQRQDFNIEFAESEEEEVDTDVTDQEVYDFIVDSQQYDFDCEYNYNLNVNIDEEIIAIANIGLWNGRRKGYKLLGNNLRNVFNCFESCDYIKVYSDGYNIQGQGCHHDGTNYVTYRKIRNDISEVQKENLIDAIYNNNDNADNYIKNYTRSLCKDFNAVYGW